MSVIVVVVVLIVIVVVVVVIVVVVAVVGAFVESENINHGRKISVTVNFLFGIVNEGAEPFN